METKRGIGNYEVRYLSEGGFVVTHKTSRGSKVYVKVPPDQELIRMYHEEVASGGPISDLLTTYISYRAVPKCGRRDAAWTRKILGLPEPSNYRVEFDQLKVAIEKFWPRDLVRAYLEKREIPPSGELTRFREENPRVYKALVRRYGKRDGVGIKRSGLERVMEDIYPGLYSLLHFADARFSEVDPGRLAEELLNRHLRGKPISKTGLEHSDEEGRALAAQISALVNNSNLVLVGGSDLRYSPNYRRRKSNKGRLRGGFTQKVVELTGLSPGDFSMDSSTKVAYASLFERLTHFTLLWSYITGIPFDENLKTGEVFSDYGSLRFSFDSQNGVADLRVGNQAIEVKAGMGMNFPVEEIMRRYSSRAGQWHTGERISRSLVVFHRPRSCLEDTVLDQLHKKGIHVLASEEFRERLGQVVTKVKEDSPDFVEGLHTRVSDLGCLVRLYDELTESPCLILRTVSRSRREWFVKVLKELIKAGEEKYAENRRRPRS